MDSAPLLDRDRQHCWHPFTQHATAADPLPVVHSTISTDDPVVGFTATFEKK